MLLCQLLAKDEALEKLQRDPREVKRNSSTSYIFPDIDFTVFENHTIGIDSKLLRRMGYEGKGLGINGQFIINPIKVVELPRQVGLWYVRKEVGECAKTDRKPPMEDDEKPSLVCSKLTVEVKYVDFSSVPSSHSIISVGTMEVPIIGTNMRLLTEKM